MTAPSARDLSLAHAMRGSMVGSVRTKVFCAHEGAEAAICARDDVLAAHDLCVAANALRDKLRVLDKIGRGVNDTRNDDQPIREVKLLEDDPFMLVPGVCTLKGESADFGL